MNKFRLSFILSIALLLSACATVYTAEDFTDYQAKHESVAILPYNVTIQLKKLPEGTTAEDISNMQKDEGYLFQQQLYAQFLQRYSKGQYTVDFQDIAKTNILLDRADIEYDTITKFTKEELAEILGVDAIISGDIKRTKPMGTGWAVASTLLLGYGATNKVTVNMTVHDSNDGAMIWSYDHNVDGGVGSSPESMAKSLMKNISKKFPYTT